MLINELKLLLGLASVSLEVDLTDLTQHCCLHWSWYSLYAGAYPDAHWLRDISSLPTALAQTNRKSNPWFQKDMMVWVGILCLLTFLVFIINHTVLILFIGLAFCSMLAMLFDSATAFSLFMHCNVCSLKRKGFCLWLLSLLRLHHAKQQRVTDLQQIVGIVSKASALEIWHQHLDLSKQCC